MGKNNLFQKKLFKTTKKFFLKRRIAFIIITIVALGTIVGGRIYASIGNSGTVQLSKGLVGWWKLDGNTKDSSPYGNDGTITGTVVTTTDRFGKANGAYSFSGSNGHYITTTNQVNYDNITVSAWVYYTDTSGGGARAIVSNSRDCGTGPCNSTNRGFNMMASYFHVDPSFNIFNTTNGNVVGTGNLNVPATPVNAWSHFVGTYDGSTLKIYLNGTLHDSLSFTQSSLGIPINTLRIGGMGQNTAYAFQGSIDDVRYYSRALNDNEITALYNEEGTTSIIKVAEGERQMRGWWKLDGNARDSSPYSNTGTITSATLVSDRNSNTNLAYSFNGSSSTISVADSTTYTFGTRPISMSAWVNFDAPGIGANQTIISQNNDSFEILKSSANKLRIEMRCSDNSTRRAEETTTSLTSSGTWYHVTATFNPSNGATVLYINGQSVAVTYVDAQSACSSSTIKDSSSSVSLGSRGASVYLDGNLDDIRIYDTVLSSKEVSAIYGRYNSVITLTRSLQQDLIGHWKFNGNLNDSTPFSNDGTIIGGVSLTTDRLGKANSAYDFNGTTGYIDTGSSALPNRLTVSAWIYMDSLATQQTAVSNARNCCDNTQRGVTLLPRHNRPSASVWGIDGLGGAYVEDPSFDPSYLSINTWYHLAMTYDGSNLRIYVNGVLGATDALSQANNGTASATLKIGRLGSYAGVFMNGKIDDVRYYSRALSDAEMITLYNTYDD